jgi:hypothetical protein
LSFDTLTIVGILAAIVCGGFLVALVSCNDLGVGCGRRAARARQRPATESGS